MKFNPVAPGWVLVPDKPQTPEEWYHIVGWTTEGIPVIAHDTGIIAWDVLAGEDKWCIATHNEWRGCPA